MKNTLIAALVSQLLLGCASLTQGTSQVITFNLEPKEAKCTLTRQNDGEIGSISSSNNTLSLSKSKNDIIVKCSAPGHKQKVLRMVSSTQTSGVVGGMLLDLGITDMITGAMWKYQDDMTVVLEKE